MRCSTQRIRPRFPPHRETCFLKRAFRAPDYWSGTDETSTPGRWGSFVLLGCPLQPFELFLGNLLGRSLIGDDVTHDHDGRQPQRRGPQVHRLDVQWLARRQYGGTLGAFYPIFVIQLGSPLHVAMPRVGSACGDACDSPELHPGLAGRS